MPAESADDIFKRTHSYRNFEPEEFLRVWENADDRNEEARARDALKYVESGRFYPMLKATYKMMIHLDRDELETFAERNPNLVDWVQIYAIYEEVRTFRGVTDIQKP